MSFNIKSLPYLFLVFVAFFTSSSFALAKGTRMLSDVAYGKSEKQVLDVYYPSVKKQGAPVIFMVHGGAWRIGDKASKSVIKNKVAHWVSKGFIFISVNYRMLPKAYPVEQAEDVTKALIFSQKNVHKWGGSPEKFILMGHSAGAHLVSLVSVNHDIAIKPWLGTVALDSAAYDVEKIMSAQSPPRFYKKAFGKSPIYWKKASPVHRITDKLYPFLAVCSSARKDNSCSQARNFVEKAKKYGTKAEFLSVPFSHRKINVKLGVDNCYTRDVDAFMKQLHPSIELMLTSQSTTRLQRQTQQSCAGY